MTTTLPMTDREKLATLADHGYAVAKLNSGCGPVDGAWTLTDPDGDHLQIGGQGGVSTTRGAAIDEGMRRIAAELASVTTPTITETFPAYAADTLGETITLTFPTAWADRVAAIVPVLSYGPNYSRAAIESLADMSRCVRDDYSTVAYDYLLTAERAARRNGIDIPELNA